MPTQILMPRLSPTMEEGKLAAWHVKEGDRVRSGDVVAEIETDKATMEVEAPEDGVIEKLLLAAGTEHVPVNHPIALLATRTRAPHEFPLSPWRTRRVRSQASARVRGRHEQLSRSPLTPALSPMGRGVRESAAPARHRAGDAQDRRADQAERRQRSRGPHFRLATGATAGARSGHRARGARRLGSAWPHRQARRRDCGDQA